MRRAKPMIAQQLNPKYSGPWTRRDFLKTMGASAASTLLLGEPRPSRAEPVQHPQATADTCILLWMAGGMAAPETFDPKRYTPFEIGVPSDRILGTLPAKNTSGDNVRISRGLASTARVMDRGTLARAHALRQLRRPSTAADLAGDYHQQAMLGAVDNAHRLLNSRERDAFDVAREPRPIFDRYNTGRFGLGCLLARRLTEAGARFIEVTSEYIPFKNWDTHENGHERAVDMKRQIDAPLAQLVLDLEERGLLDRTLVVLASEFGRDMMVEGKPGKLVKDQGVVPTAISQPKHYGMHRHFTDAGSVLIFGAGARRGFLYGKTADERPCNTIENPVAIENLHTNLYRRS